MMTDSEERQILIGLFVDILKTVENIERLLEEVLKEEEVSVLGDLEHERGE
jgi:hypothetical protein